VKSGFKSGWIKGMEIPHPPQGAKVLQTLERGAEWVERAELLRRIPADDGSGESVPFSNEVGGGVSGDPPELFAFGLDSC